MTTDTRAALDAAIDEWIRLRGLSYLTGGAQAAQTARGQVDHAITAHVEAEVTRRLAVAPGVEEAIDNLVMAQRHVVESELADHVNRSAAVIHDAEADRNAAEAALRAAIAADRERAVAEATDGAVQGERFAAEICRLVGARETGAGGQTVDACTASLYANAAKRIERMLARDKARPTPDEARRLVGEYAAAHGALVLLMHGGQYDPHDDEGARRAAAESTRDALLRALGVEA